MHQIHRGVRLRQDCAACARRRAARPRPSSTRRLVAHAVDGGHGCGCWLSVSSPGSRRGRESRRCSGRRAGSTRSSCICWPMPARNGGDGFRRRRPSRRTLTAAPARHWSPWTLSTLYVHGLRLADDARSAARSIEGGRGGRVSSFVAGDQRVNAAPAKAERAGILRHVVDPAVGDHDERRPPATVGTSRESVVPSAANSLVSVPFGLAASALARLDDAHVEAGNKAEPLDDRGARRLGLAACGRQNFGSGSCRPPPRRPKRADRGPRGSATDWRAPARPASHVKVRAIVHCILFLNRFE